MTLEIKILSSDILAVTHIIREKKKINNIILNIHFVKENSNFLKDSKLYFYLFIFYSSKKNYIPYIADYLFLSPKIQSFIIQKEEKHLIPYWKIYQIKF